MTELNAGLLQIPDLMGQINAQKLQQQQKISNALSAVSGYMEDRQQQKNQAKFNEILSANFDPTNGKLNHDGVIKDLYTVDPQKAETYRQEYMTKDFTNQKAAADIGKIGAETGKLGAETGKIGAETGEVNAKTAQQKQATEIEGITQVGQMLANIKSPEQWTNVVKYAKSKGFDTSMFDDVDPYNDQQRNSAISQASSMIISETDKYKEAANRQNADTNLINAQINQQRANQDFNINKERNQIDWGNLGVNQEKANVDMLNAQREAEYGSPEQQLKAEIANNALIADNMDRSSEMQSQINNLTKAAEVGQLMFDNSTNILNNPLISNGSSDGDDKYNTVWANINRNWRPGSNEYKQLDAEYSRFISQAQGKGLIDMKALSATGSAGVGAVSDAENRMFGSLQNAPSKEDFMAMSPKVRIETLQGIQNAIKEGTEARDKRLAKIVEQHEIINNRKISLGRGKQSDNQGVPQIYPSARPNPPSDMNLPTSLPTYGGEYNVPKLGNKIYKSSDGTSINQIDADNFRKMMEAKNAK